MVKVIDSGAIQDQRIRKHENLFNNDIKPLLKGFNFSFKEVMDANFNRDIIVIIKTKGWFGKKIMEISFLDKEVVVDRQKVTDGQPNYQSFRDLVIKIAKICEAPKLDWHVDIKREDMYWVAWPSGYNRGGM